ncbi:hypothetical protein DPMN_066121 [Dreissena polymorpha]|uniref:Uncharacterized protein n=1 Tax=Dreissena polymorpha TaxID=45954 RepID=A0A9D3YSW6_DREPO|nr:hypothetical protein DPMN_066121 [Dreissena polymorpha]
MFSSTYVDLGAVGEYETGHTSSRHAETRCESVIHFINKKPAVDKCLFKDGNTLFADKIRALDATLQGARIVRLGGRNHRPVTYSTQESGD